MRRIIKPFLLLILLQCVLKKVACQIKFTAVEGLLQKTVYALSQDPAGFLWIGTGNGIQRYDGYEMKNYRVAFDENTHGLSGRFIRNGFLCDGKENLWFSTENGTQYLHRRSGKVITCYIRIDGKRLPLQGTFPLATDQHQYWLVNETSGLFLYDPLKETALRYPVPELDGRSVPVQIRGVVDVRGNFWFASSRGIFRFHRINRHWELMLPGRAFTVLSVAGDSILAGSGKDVYFYHLPKDKQGRISKETIPAAGNLLAMHTADNGAVWMGDDKGNLFVQTQRNHPAKWMGNINTSNREGPLHPVYCLYTSREGTLWVGTDVLGLMCAPIKNAGFQLLPEKEADRKSFFVQSVLPNGPNNVLLGLYQRGVVEADLKSGSIRPFLPPCSTNGLNKSAMVLNLDTGNRWWIFHCGVLEISEKSRRQTIAIEPPPGVLSSKGSITANVLKPYKNGWLLGTSIGLYFISSNDGIYRAHHITHTGYTCILDIWLHPYNNEVWLGLETGGIGIIRNLQQQQKPASLPGQEKNSIRQFLYHPQEPDWLWAATLNGLLCIQLSTGRQQLYHKEHGILNSYLSGVAKTDEFVWISGNGGISRARSGRLKTGSSFPTLEFENFDTEDGLPTNEFNAGACYYQPGGRLLLGSSSGLVWVDPSTFRLARQPTIPRITEIQVNDKPLTDTILPEWMQQLHLNWQQQSLFLKFTGFGFQDADKLQYRYYLKGWDAGWVKSGTTREVRYNQLSPGNYTFYASVRYQGNVWSPPAALQISIQPPFWKQPLFYIPLCAMGVVLVFLAIRYISRRRLLLQLAALQQQQQMEKERLRISREMHDDIGAGLTQITLMSEALATEHHHQKVAEIADISRRLINNMGEIIWSLNRESSSLQELFAYMREHLTDFLDQQPIEFVIDFQKTAANPLLDFKQKRNILLLVKEAVHNAVKHSGATQLHLFAAAEKDWLNCMIRDNGKGFDTTTQSGGNGLKNMQTRAAALDAVLQIDSKPTKGTSVYLSIPLKGLLSKSH